MTAVAEWAAALGPATGRLRVVAVEGRSGAGKSGFADTLAAALGASLIRMDEIYPGWDGLLAAVTTVHDRVLVPLAAGRPARWRLWDWANDGPGQWHEVPATDNLVVEGVGCGARALRPYTSGLVWIEAPEAVRHRRAMARDGDTYAPHWRRWARQEEAFYRANDVRGRADLIIENDRENP
ncbi:dephospho-CoA kinase [Actinoplanes sp. NPDC051494]|uniref:dephospho-CoA kinase n=1 Tax=Actinoplanes sp. NPDC051494 TaxID=3363907 RepID=UPI003795D2BC